MTYYIDFDNTLFNTEKFYYDLLKILAKYNISEEHLKKSSKQKIFNPLKALELLIINDIRRESILSEVTSFLKDLTMYLYDDVNSFLSFLQTKGQVILLTYGDVDYQLNKINGCYIKNFFKEIIITSQDKDKLSISYQNNFFIDDSAYQLSLLQKKTKNIVRIMRIGNKHSMEHLEGVLTFNNLVELEKYLQINN